MEELDRKPRIERIEIKPHSQDHKIQLCVERPNHRICEGNWRGDTDYLEFSNLEQFQQFIDMLEEVKRKLLYSGIVESESFAAAYPPPATPPETEPAAAPAATTPKTPAFTVDGEGNIIPDATPKPTPPLTGDPVDNDPF